MACKCIVQYIRSVGAWSAHTGFLTLSPSPISTGLSPSSPSTSICHSTLTYHGPVPKEMLREEALQCHRNKNAGIDVRMTIQDNQSEAWPIEEAGRGIDRRRDEGSEGKKQVQDKERGGTKKRKLGRTKGNAFFVSSRKHWRSRLLDCLAKFLAILPVPARPVGAHRVSAIIFATAADPRRGLRKFPHLL